MKRKTQPKQQTKSPTHAQLGEMLANIYESGYLDRTQAYKMSFIKGALGGLGGAIGATVVLGVIIWVLSFFGSVPLVGRLVENVRDTVNSESR